MLIKGLLLTDESVSISYVVDKDGVSDTIKLVTDDMPHKDLFGAVRSLKDIFVSRMQFESVQDRVNVVGFSVGKDSYGDIYKIVGVYTAHMKAYKIVTGKLRMSQEEVDPYETPDFLTEEEGSLVYKAIKEAVDFVNGKRSQKELRFEEE